MERLQAQIEADAQKFVYVDEDGEPEPKSEEITPVEQTANDIESDYSSNDNKQTELAIIEPEELIEPEEPEFIP